MQTVNDLRIFEHPIVEDQSWNLSETKELLMHRIHAYPAKFPAFLTPKIVNHIKKSGKNVNSVVDIFCGCGTSALETKLLSIDFHGFDINPVATLIAKTKSTFYNDNTLVEYFNEIVTKAETAKFEAIKAIKEHERITYWFTSNAIDVLYRILKSIKHVCPQGKYRNFFLTAFSNVLKPCSRWLTKSIKPQVDPNKNPLEPLEAFKTQFSFMRKANQEVLNLGRFNSKVEIRTQNILRKKTQESFADLVITSPPYVTSYEYADLHQLSTLWLGYVDDYRELRNGTIGSEYMTVTSKRLKYQLNTTGETICRSLDNVDPSKSKAVRKYFEDMDKTVKQVGRFLNNDGHAAFVIGDTSYKNVHIDNAKYLTHCFIENDYKDISITKRKISSKILTPFRDKAGRFSNDSKGSKVYSHEYLIIAQKNNRNVF